MPTEAPNQSSDEKQIELCGVTLDMRYRSVIYLDLY
jgi:hypothetical protein